MDALIDYVQPLVAITDYVEYCERDFVIGSGMMESTCKQLVGKRLKGCGRQWSEAGALAMSGLISEWLNRTWETIWATRPLHQAA